MRIVFVIGDRSIPLSDYMQDYKLHVDELLSIYK